MATTAARNAVHRHAPAISTRLATDQMSDGLSWSCSGWPVTSETVNGTSSAAHTVQIAEATVPSRSARYPAGVEHTAVLRRHEERREHERPDGHDGRDLAGGPHERQAVGGDRARGWAVPWRSTRRPATAHRCPPRSTPASRATPNNTGHTALLRTLGTRRGHESSVWPALIPSCKAVTRIGTVVIGVPLPSRRRRCHRGGMQRAMAVPQMPAAIPG